MNNTVVTTEHLLKIIQFLNEEKKHEMPLPVYIRPPKKGREYFTGLSRSKLYQLEKEMKITGISLSDRDHKQKGIKLFKLRSIIEHIESKAK